MNAQLSIGLHPSFLMYIIHAYLCVSQLFEVQSANEWKTIDINSFFPENDDGTSVIVKCSTWSADGSRIFCAAKNAVFVSDCSYIHLQTRQVEILNIFYKVIYVCIC